MRRALCVVLLLVSALALAETDPGQISRGDLLKNRTFQTTSALNLFVDSTGSDANACTSSGSGACLTIQGALSKLPTRIIGVTATITVGTGSFAGAQISGISVTPSSTGGAGYLIVQGTFPNFTPATGTGSGTLSAFSASSGSTFAVFTDGTQTWTVNNLVGKLLKITGGTGAGAGTTYVITSNTASTITTAGSATGFNATSTYQILDWGTIINSPVPAESGSVTGTGQYPTAGIRIATDVGGFTGSSLGNILIQGFHFAFGSNTRGIQSDTQSRVWLRWNKHSTSNLGGIVTDGPTTVDSCYFTTGTTQAVSTLGLGSSAFGLYISGDYFENGSTGVSANFVGLNVSNTLFKGQTTAAIRIQSGIIGWSLISSSRFDGPAIALSIQSSISNGGAIASLGLQFSDLSNATTAAIDLNSPKGSLFTGSGVTGTGNAIGLKLRFGAHAEIDSSTTLTGTTEVQMDGDPYTFAAMRALTPKSICNLAYGTCFYE